MSAPRLPCPYGTLQSIAAVLADKSEGLTGRETGDLLPRLRMENAIPRATKRDRLNEAFVARQSADRSSERIITFLVTAMQPVQCRNQPELFTLRKDRFNEHLAFVALRVNDEAKAAKGAVAQTLDEASLIDTSIRDEMLRRRRHLEVLRYFLVEVLKKAHFHAILEATNNIFVRLRGLTGASGDRSAWVDTALALGKSGVSMLAITLLPTQIEKDEQTGLTNLVKGLNRLYRNPTAHDTRLNRSISEDELLELLTKVSMVHRRLGGTRHLEGVR